MDWQTVWLTAISVYLARRWYIRHYKVFHGAEVPHTLIEPIEGDPRGRIVTVYVTPPRWSGVRRAFGAQARERHLEQRL